MMTVPMKTLSAPSSGELAERLYRKNIELETALRKFAKSRVPSDPNAWFQIRENYETIILEDHAFSEKHEVELALWQLHYRKIEEFRGLLNSAKSAATVSAQEGRTPLRPDSIKKFRSGFKTFLSESTGFYHDLILKVRAKFGLPLGFFSDGAESQTTSTNDEKKSAAMKKGLMSCHRSLIYLGDLARYKGQYGEGDSVSREYAAASSYYKQAASLYPSSGNPHHQLAILASYSCDDLVTIYRYFRSLAADIPFSTARDNLIIAFEKNRQSFSQLPANPKPVAAKPLAARTSGRGRGRGRGDTRLLSKDFKPEATSVKEHELSIPEVLKGFSTRFIRVNGILFTRTSLETFGEIFSSVKTDLLNLLSSGPEEELKFDQDGAENGLLIVRLIAMLIFTVHNVNRESDGPTYAEILQRTVLLQNAFMAAFEFAGCVIKRCTQLRDATSSFLLPAILVFIEWLASHPDIAAGSDVEEKQASARSFFWNQCVTLMNKLVLSGLASGDGDTDETCFFDMSQYDEGQTGNRLALWEDFELRGFLPLVPAQMILDFSRKHSYGSDGGEERRARVQRILAAGRALMNMVRVDQKAIYFDSGFKKFVIGIQPPEIDDYMCNGLSDSPKLNAIKQSSPVDRPSNHGMIQPTAQLYVHGEDDEEEEIVFKPSVGEKHPGAIASTSMSTVHEVIQPPLIHTEKESATTPTSTASETIQPAQISTKGDLATALMSTAYESIQPAQIASKGEWAKPGTQLPLPNGNFQASSVLQSNPPLDAASINFLQQPLPHMNLNTSKWLMEQAAILSNGVKNFNINRNGLLANHGSQEGLNSLQSTAFAFSPLISSSPHDPINRTSGQAKVVETYIPSALDSIMSSGITYDGLYTRPSGPAPNTSKKTPVSRPVRRLGPPPGFSDIPPKQLNDSSLQSMMNGQNLQIDDYSWLDGYQSSSTKGLGIENTVNHAAHIYQHPTTDTITSLNGPMSFPFPGKQMSTVQTPVVNERWQNFQLFDNLSIPKQQPQQAGFQPSVMPDQHQQAHSLWSGYFV